MGIQRHRLHVYYGYGKGKTTTAIGLAIRMLGAGKKAVLIQFDKGHRRGREHYSERKVLRTLSQMALYSFGRERVLGPNAFRFRNESEDFKEAQAALAKSMELIRSGKQDLLILDELLAAVMCKLLTQKDVMELVKLYDRKRRCEMVITGHQVWPGLIKKADLVTEMRKVKHYFDKKLPSKEGIEY